MRLRPLLLLLTACVAPQRPAAPPPAAETPILVDASATTGALLESLRAYARTQPGAGEDCFLALRREAPGLPILRVGAGAASTTAAFTCDAQALSPIVEGRGVFLEEWWASQGGAGLKPEAYLRHYGPRGRAFVGRPQTLTGVGGPAAEAIADLDKHAQEDVIVIAVPLSPGEAPGDAPSPPATPAPAGGLTWEDILPVLQAGSPGFQKCARGDGSVVVDFTIDGEGKVPDVGLLSSSFAEPSVDECVVAALKTLAFPRPKDGQPVLVSFPVLFGAPPASGH